MKYLSRRRRRLRRRNGPLTLALLAALLLGGGLLLARAWRTCGFAGCPDVETLTAYQPEGASQLLDRNGRPFADLAPVDREVVAVHALPTRVPQAFVAVEDRRFYEHDGVDWRRTAGALLANLRSRSRDEGGSTISMQLARNLFPEEIPGAERSAQRKLLEVRVAREIERKFSKPEILELYLNHIYFGNGARGVQAAARQYFGVPAEELTLAQAALLAALPKAPSHYDPRRHPRAARERRDLVLGLMAAQGRVPAGEAEAAQREPLGVGPRPRRTEREGPADYFVEEVRRRLEEHFGKRLYERPVRVWTTLDLGAQRAAREELERQLRSVESGAAGAFRGTRYDPAVSPAGDAPDYLQGAVVVLRVPDGDVLAWVGGRDFRHSQFDRAAGARRQAGSAFKPFVFAAALEEGWALSQPVADRPLAVRLANGRVWRPKNLADRYEGEVSVREALVLSKNVPTVRLARAVGYSKVAALARRMGIERPIPRLASMPLGTVAVSPLELTAAYSAFAGLGRRVEPRFVLRVESPEGELLWRPLPQRTAALAPGAAYLLNHALGEALERGSGAPVRAAGYRGLAAGKTGTSNDGVDAWFVGYDPELLAGVWIGFDEPAPIAERATGGRLAAPVWARIMSRLAPGRRVPLRWSRPADVVARPIDPATGLVLEPGCRPASGRPRHELFLEGAVPESHCPGRGEPAPQVAAAQGPVGAPARELAARQEAERRARALREREEAARLERERLGQERAARLERERLAQERAARLEQERLAQEQKARVERDRLAQERKARLELERLAQERAARLEGERLAEERKARLEGERLAQERKARLEKERLAREREAERRAAAEQAVARAERDRQARDRETARVAEEAARAEEIRVREAQAREELRRAEEQARARQARERDERLAREAAAAEERRVREERAAAEEREEQAATDAEMRARAAEERRRIARELAMREPRDEAPAGLSGWWEVTNRIESTSFAAYQGLRLGYRIRLQQDGDRLSGDGEKWSEDGRTLPAAQRTPILLSGRIDGENVTLDFTEHGARRITNGTFTWRLSADGSGLSGSFASTAADTRGSSRGRRIP
ncbi:MAG TPA: PBP1A family penicillin-binding protein [Thermoanaerobaculia bacterium]|nr:PBP1A family penicillin-binding protein [Thermoanaerobaculia bacterium]